MKRILMLAAAVFTSNGRSAVSNQFALRELPSIWHHVAKVFELEPRTTERKRVEWQMTSVNRFDPFFMVID